MVHSAPKFVRGHCVHRGHYLWLFSNESPRIDLYYLAFPEDRVLAKVLVYGVYILESAQVFLMLPKGIRFYGFQIYNNHVLFSLHKLPHMSPSYLQYTATSLIGGIGMFECQLSATRDLLWFKVAFVVQSFYAYRLRIIGRSPIIAIVIVSVSLVPSPSPPLPIGVHTASLPSIIRDSHGGKFTDTHPCPP